MLAMIVWPPYVPEIVAVECGTRSAYPTVIVAVSPLLAVIVRWPDTCPVVRFHVAVPVTVVSAVQATAWNVSVYGPDPANDV